MNLRYEIAKVLDGYLSGQIDNPTAIDQIFKITGVSVHSGRSTVVCTGTNRLGYSTEGSRIIDCPDCGRPVTVRESGAISPHRPDRTSNTDRADERLRQLREAGIR